ncbi:hypothetical protein TNCV_2389631 [Trichonephila clavipes]|nr:hypothetical protein TNCV_2389631 [Trichonephila clavipes]
MSFFGIACRTHSNWRFDQCDPKTVRDMYTLESKRALLESVLRSGYSQGSVKEMAKLRGVDSLNSEGKGDDR